ncbi:hypothetical protein M0805_006172 [Coniferiporia weirii]|nr:hypothetical protein M0805_006172 [Coniferiporia weirii]
MSATSSSLCPQLSPQRSVEPARVVHPCASSTEHADEPDGEERRLVPHGLVVENDEKETVNHCAVKVVKRSMVGVSCKEITKNEEKILKKLREAAFLKGVQLEETLCDASNRYIVMEFIPGGTLASAVRRAGGSLEPTHVRYITAELVYALLFLKDQGIVHRDVKPENVLLTARGGAVLSDFGIAVDFTTRYSQVARGACGTPGYMAPEVLGRLPYSFEADAFSLGCTIYFCFAGESPFKGHGYGECERRTLTQAAVFLDELGWCFYSKHFVSRLLEKNATLRLTLEEAIDTAYLEGIEWDRVKKGNYDLPGKFTTFYTIHDIDFVIVSSRMAAGASTSLLPWSTDVEDSAYITSLRPTIGNREQQEGGPTRSARERLERDARMLFKMPDDILIPIQLEVSENWRLGNMTPDDLARTPSLVESSPSGSMVAGDDRLGQRPVVYSVKRGQAMRMPVRGVPAGEFVPRLVPDPHNEIPAHYTEEQVRVCERFLVDVRSACAERGPRGLGFANVPELALMMSTAALITAPTAPARPLLQRPLSKPWFSTIQEKEFKMSQLPVRMSMRLYFSDFKRAVRRVLRMSVEED